MYLKVLVQLFLLVAIVLTKTAYQMLNGVQISSMLDLISNDVWQRCVAKMCGKEGKENLCLLVVCLLQNILMLNYASASYSLMKQLVLLINGRAKKVGKIFF